MNRFSAVHLLLGLALVVSLVIATTVGSVEIPWIAIVSVMLTNVIGVASIIPVPDQQAYEAIVMHLRLPRVVLAGLVGGGLALAGAVLQGLFRNPMADPGIIGVSGGGALGAVVAVLSGFAAKALWSLPLMAFAGAAGATWTIYRLSTRAGQTPLATLLLAGLAVSAFASAVTSLLLSMAQDIFALREVLFWLLGGLDGRGWPHVRLAAVPILTGGLGLALCARELNIVAAAGEEGATSLGVDMQWVKRRVLLLTALVTGAAVSVSGIVGFVGLIVPHIVRLLVGPDHRALLPASFLGGASFLIWADLAARVLLPSQELRLGVVTALLGAPFFMYLLQRHRVRTEEL
jgi:iron complex transport system permease protein